MIKKIALAILTFLALTGACFAAPPVPSNYLWQYGGTTYIHPNSGQNILVKGTSKYLNFGYYSGSTGYGFRDNSGTIEFKDNAGAWQAIAPAGSGNVEDGTAAGQMVFWDGSSEYKHTEISEMIWDDTNKRIGIGIDTPTDTLTVGGTAGYNAVTDMGTQDTDFASKKYIDDGIWLMPPIIEWYDPVAEGGLPVDPEIGDRYGADSTGYGWTIDYIYEWDGAEWEETAPEEGWMIWDLFGLIFWAFFSGGWMEINNVEDGTEQGQMTFWDATTGRWENTETTELYWDDTNKELNVLGQLNSNKGGTQIMPSTSFDVGSFIKNGTAFTGTLYPIAQYVEAVKGGGDVGLGQYVLGDATTLDFVTAKLLVNETVTLNPAGATNVIRFATNIETTTDYIGDGNDAVSISDSTGTDAVYAVVSVSGTDVTVATALGGDPGFINESATGIYMSTRVTAGGGLLARTTMNINSGHTHNTSTLAVRAYGAPSSQIVDFRALNSTFSDSLIQLTHDGVAGSLDIQGTNNNWSVTNEGYMSLSGDLSFVGTATHKVGSAATPNAYAFQYYTGAYGLHFSASNGAYEFTDVSGNPLVQISAGNGNITTDGNLILGDGTSADNREINFNTNNVDSLLQVTSTADLSYLIGANAYLFLGVASNTYQIGDIGSTNNGTYLEVDDGNSSIDSITNTLNFGRGTSADVISNWIGGTNTGIITWKDTEDQFEFADDVVMSKAIGLIDHTGATRLELNSDTGKIQLGNTADRVKVGINNTAAYPLIVTGDLSTAKTGTVTVASASNAVTGSGTDFENELEVGAAVKIADEIFLVDSITDATHLTLDSNHSAGASGVTLYGDADYLFALGTGDNTQGSIFTIDKVGKWDGYISGRSGNFYYNENGNMGINNAYNGTGSLQSRNTTDGDEAAGALIVNSEDTKIGILGAFSDSYDGGTAAGNALGHFGGRIGLLDYSAFVGGTGGIDIATSNDLKIYTGGILAANKTFEISTTGAVTFNNAFTFPTADGTADQVLTTDGSGAVTWEDAGGGDVVGPASAVDNNIAVYDGTTGKLIKDPGITVAASGSSTYTFPASTSTLASLLLAETFTNKTFDDEVTLQQIATPSNPSAGYNSIYAKSDDKLYILTSAGVETRVGLGDVVGPSSAVSGNLAAFDGTTGKLIKDGLLSPTINADGFTLAGGTTPRSLITTGSDVTITGNADGGTINAGTTPRDLDWTGANITLTGSGSNTYTFPASTSTLMSLGLAETVSGDKTYTGAMDAGGATFELPNGTALPATCSIGELFQDTDSDDCADTGSGDGALCICKSADTWALISNF